MKNLLKVYETILEVRYGSVISEKGVICILNSALKIVEQKDVTLEEAIEDMFYNKSDTAEGFILELTEEDLNMIYRMMDDDNIDLKEAVYRLEALIESEDEAMDKLLSDIMEPKNNLLDCYYC